VTAARPAGSSGAPLAKKLGFTDVNVCAVDDVWSGPKFVVRKELRPGARK